MVLKSPMGHPSDSPPHPDPPSLEAFIKPYNAIWKEGKPFVRNEGGVDILVDALGALARQSLVMVRIEYAQIFQHILVFPTFGESTVGLVVTGQPGIGT